MGICHCKFSQPNLSSISDQESLHYRSGDKVDQPVVEVLELLHDQVHLTVVVVSGEVVHPAAQTLTRIKEAVKPFEIPTSRSRTHENLTIHLKQTKLSQIILNLVRIQSLYLNPGGCSLLRRHVWASEASVGLIEAQDGVILVIHGVADVTVPGLV